MAAEDDNFTILDLIEISREMGLGLLNVDFDPAWSPLWQKSDQILSLNPDWNAALIVALAASVRNASEVEGEE